MEKDLEDKIANYIYESYLAGNVVDILKPNVASDILTARIRTNNLLIQINRSPTASFGVNGIWITSPYAAQIYNGWMEEQRYIETTRRQQLLKEVAVICGL